jgi:hypothetical protein
LLLQDPKAKRLLEESNKYENTPLHIAAKKGFINVVRVSHEFCMYVCVDGTLLSIYALYLCDLFTFLQYADYWFRAANKYLT